MKVEVVYALPQQQYLIAIDIPDGSTVEQAIQASGLIEKLNLDLSGCGVGIFSKKVSWQDKLSNGDRVEIYRPLLADPKQARKRRC